jgi:hypothetical protein
MSPRRCLLSIAIVAATAGTACGDDPPRKEIQQAQAAIDAAKTAGADRYARDDFSAAEAALAAASDALTQRDYRLALTRALNARERAQTAAHDAADRRTAARGEAERALAAADLSVARARTRLADAARGPARALADARRTLADAERAVQEARTAFEREDYAAAIEAATAGTARLHAVERDLETLAAATPRRRR